MGMHGQGKYAAAQIFRTGQARGIGACPARVGRLKVNGNGIVHGGGNSPFGQRLGKSVTTPPRRSDDKQMPDRGTVRRNDGKFQPGDIRQPGKITSGRPPPVGIVRVKAGKAHAQQRGLKLVKAGVEARFLADIAPPPAVLAQFAHP